MKEVDNNGDTKRHSLAQTEAEKDKHRNRLSLEK